VTRSRGRQDEQGDVVVGVYVNSNGYAKKITVARSRGFEELDDAAAASAASWPYIPATKRSVR
jgi:TonB family protein